MIVLIVGPSGVGKTVAYESAEPHFPDVIFGHLDGLAAQWAFEAGLIEEECYALLDRSINDPELFLSIGQHAIGKLSGENPDKHLVIDVGAGFQVAGTAAQLHRLFRIVAITAKPKAAHKRIVRARNDQRSLNQYRREEYAPNRVAVYESAHFTIDSTRLSQDETRDRFVTVLQTIFASSSHVAALGAPIK